MGWGLVGGKCKNQWDNTEMDCEKLKGKHLHSQQVNIEINFEELEATLAKSQGK